MNTSILIRTLVICVSLAPTALVHSESTAGIAHTPTEESQPKDSQSKRNDESDGLWHNATRTPVRAAVTSALLTSGVSPLLAVCAVLSRVGAIEGFKQAPESPNIDTLSAAGAVTLHVTSAAFLCGAVFTYLAGCAAGFKFLVLCTR